MAEQPFNSPLTEDHLEQIKRGIAAAEDGLRQVEVARRAGIDLTPQEQELNAQLVKLRQIRQVYFPGR